MFTPSIIIADIVLFFRILLKRIEIIAKKAVPPIIVISVRGDGCKSHAST